nr:metallophosphoesterase [Clostridia bacterium]
MCRTWLLRLLLLALIVLAVIALDQRVIVRTYTVESDKVNAPVRLVVLTDYHGCDYGEGLIPAVEALQPDAVLLPGDIFDDGMPWGPSEELVRGLAEKYPCYYVTGNHEYWSGGIEEICRIIEAAGVTVLDQACAGLTVNGQQLNICGIPDPYAYVDTEVALARAAADIKQDDFTVLLAHRPELIEQYAATGAFDLVVSGHAHGGQVRIPGLANGLYAPNQGWLPKYAGGLYDVDGTTLIVSRGLARESTRLPRVFNRPEIVLIEVK